MPDFDKDLVAPVNKPKAWDLPPQVKAYTAQELLDGGADYAHTDDIFDKIDLAGKRSQYDKVGVPVTYGELEANKRYDAFNPTIDNMEDFAAYGQSTVDKALNGILKGTNLAATTVAGGFGMVGGAIKWALPGGKFSDIWDNEYMRTLDDWNTKVDQEFLPNYYTDAEKNAEWYSTTNWMTSNFLFDKLIKNAGFAVGAMVGGNIANAALRGGGALLGTFAAEGALLAEGSQAFQKLTPLLRNAARAFSAGKNIEAAAILESQVSSIADLSTKTAALGRIAETTNKFANFGQQARRIGIAGYSTGGEASFEALQTSKELRNNLIEEYKRNHGGAEPSGDDLANINSTAESAGKVSFLGNLAILGVTEYFQLPKLLGSSYSAEKQAANSLLGRVGEIELVGGAYVAAKGATTRFGKLAEKVGGIGKYVFDPKEAAQENLQYALQVGTQNYYNKAYRTNDADVLVDGVLHGFVGRDKEGKAIGSLISKEGIESAILGGITGGLMQARGTYQQGKIEQNNTDKFLTLLNGAPEFRSAFMDRMNSINRDVILQQQKQAAVIQGDKLEAKDLETDLMHNYLSTRIKYGRFDMVKEDIAELRRAATTEEGLAQLKEEGIANVNDTTESYRNRLNNFERVANYTNEIYKSADLRYSGETNEDGSRKYSPELIDKMVYASAKITDYDLRIPLVNATLSENGINTFDVLASIIKEGKPNKTATKEALKQINDLDVISEIKDELKTALSDVVEMSLRRKLYMAEYDAMKADPDTYTVPDDELESQFARAKQLTVDEEGKKKTVSVDLEVGKEYSLRQPIRREGNQLQLAPKLTVLSKTLGGEFEVKLPNGEVTFFKPEDFKNYALSSADNTSIELADMLNKAITDVLGRKEFAGVTIPEGVNPLEFLNSSDNKALVDAVQADFAKKSEEFLKNQAEELANKERVQAIADKVNQFQTEVAKNSGTVATDIPSLEQEVSTSSVTMNKVFSRLFTSTTGPGEGAVLKPHQVRFNSFLNNAKNFKNRGKLQAIMFTYKQQKALGLDGVIEMAWNTEPGKLDATKLTAVTNPKKGNVMVAFVQVDKNGKQSFVDANGNSIGQVGQPVDINKVVFSTMPTSETYTESADGKRTNRFRAGEEEQAEQVAKAWQTFRDDLFAAPETAKPTYGFKISKGIPIINKAAPEKNSVGQVLVPEDKIATQEGLVQVPTTGNIAHEDGENYKFPNGRPVLVYGDTLQFINNSVLTNKKATAVYNLLKELSNTLNSVAKSDKPLTFDPKKMAFLQNVLFWDPSGKTADSANKIYINDQTGDLHIGDQVYDFANIEKSKDAIMAQLETVYHNVNNKTLSLGLAQKFYEYTETGAVVEWPNYQSYLLSGKGRSIAETPLTTSVSKATDAVPYSYNQKYAYFEEIDLPYEIVKPTPTVEKEGMQVYETQNFGNINYTVVTENGEPQVTVPLTDNPSVDKIAKDPKTLVVINDALTQIDLFDDLDTAEESVAKFLANQIKASLVSAKPAEEAAPAAEEAPVEEKPKGKRDQPAYRRVGSFGAKAITPVDIEAFKQWAAEKLPVMPYEFLDNIIRTHDGKAAWGAFEKGVAKIFKGAARGTEYHEAFHFVFRGFLSTSEQEAIFSEFRNKKGTFLDTASGKKIDYADATDLQIEERIADDFTDFRLGKLPARTLGESVRRFFKAIVDFFKSFVNNPSLKDDLFNSIETGEFKDKAYPNAVVDRTAAYKEVPGIANEQMVNDFVQDITANIFLEMFGNNKSLFKPDEVTSQQLFDTIREKTQDYDYYVDLSDDAWNALVDKTKTYLKKYKIEFDEDSRVTINDETADRNSYAAETFSINYKKSSPYAVKLLVGTLIKTKPLNLAYGMALKESDYLESSIDGFQLVPYGEAFSTLLNRLQNTKDVNQFVDKLVTLAREKSEYMRLFKRLGGNLETGQIDFGQYEADDWRLFTNFFQVFSKVKPGAVKQFRDGLKTYSGSANQATEANQLENEWTEGMLALADNPESLVYRDTDKFYKVDQEALAKLPIGNKGVMIYFLEKLGINYPLSAYNKLKGKQLKEFADAVASIKLGLTQAPNNVRTLKGDALDINKGLGKLASLYVATTGTNLNTTFYNAEGKQQQEFTDNNAPSYFESVFNTVETLDELMQKMPQLQDVFSVNSQILKKGGLFFDKEGNRIEGTELNVNFIVGDQNKLTNEGKSAASLSIGDRMSLEINQNLNGNYYILIPADGSTEWMMSMGNQVSYLQFALGEGMNDAYKIFEGYLKDEIALAQDAQNRKKLNNVGDKASELRFFKDIISGKLLQGVTGLINSSAGVTKIDAFLDKSVGKIEEEGVVVKTNRDLLNEAVKQFIDGTVAETKDLLLSNNQIVNVNDGYYSYDNLDSSFARANGIVTNRINESQLTNILTFANTNYAINNIEYHKILFGDPYQFKIEDGKLDETKRIKSFLSPRRFTFDTPEFNTFLNQDMNKVGNIQLTKDDYGFHQFKNYLKTFTAKDVKIIGSITKLFPAYAKVDEADASSWITPEAYREVKMKNGQWSEEAEAFYQWQMAYTRQELAKKNDYTYGNEALRKHDAKLMRDQPKAPQYYIEVLKPIVSGNKNAKNNIDLVLDKFSQLPIFYSAVKGTNLENLYMQMFKGGYDYAVVESGRKVGAEGLHPLYNSNGDFNKEAFNNTVEVPWTSYGIQVENSYEKDKLQTRGSQLTKLATVDLYSNGEAINPEIDDAVKYNTKILNELTVAGYTELINKLGIKDLGDGYMVFDKTAVADTLRQQMLAQELSDNAIDSVTLDPQTGEFIVPFEASTNYIQIKNILYSVVNKSIIRTKMSGFPGTQVSASMWENASEGRKLVAQDVNGDWVEISKEDFEDLSPAEQAKVKFTSSALKFYTKEEPWCEVLLPNWMKGQFGDMTEEQILDYLDTPEGTKILSGIGFRIPTQALSSVEVFKVKGFLPEYMGRTVVVPSEITTKAGSDFDIDKLNMYLKATYVDASGKVRLIEYKESEEATKEFYGKLYDQINAKPEAKTQLAEQYGDLLKSLYVEEIVEEEVIDTSRDNFVDKMYKRSLENEYYASLERILTFPENFDRLLNPNTDATLKDLAAEMDRLEGINEGEIKNKMIDRNYLTQLRQSFITAKKWVGVAAVNITGNSLVQKSKIYFKTGNIFLDHNTVNVDGVERMTLSTSKDKANKYISDKLSEYANAFVDVAKDPYILKVVYSNRVVGSFMVLERLGVPTEDVAMFMNQPIIKKYIQYLDSINAGGNLENKENLAYIHSLFPATDANIQEAKLDASKLAGNIETYAKSKGKSSEKFNAEQRALLKEFIKVTQFASENFEFTQAINYDTTSFGNADELDKKQLRTDLAKNGNISSVDGILKTSFIGDQKFYLDKASDALGTILKFNESDFRGVIKSAIRAYSANKYMKNDKFSSVAEKLNASFLDYIILTKGNIDVAGLTTGPNSVAVRVEQAKAKYPQIKILQQFVVETSENLDGGAKTIRLKGNIKDAYDENLHISYMKEMRNYPQEEVKQLYKDIVKLSIVQGTYMSSVSIKNIIPLQDYADVVAPIMNNLVVDEDVRNFAKLAMFERNSWKGYDSAVTRYIPAFWKGKRDTTGQVIPLSFYEDHEPLGPDVNGKQVYQWYSPAIQKEGVLRVYPYSQGAGDNVLAVDRIVRTKTQGLIDFVTGRTITPAHYKELQTTLGAGINKVFGYQRVNDIYGNPLIDTDPKSGIGYFIYKPINLLGDGKLAYEHKLFPTKSVFNNNTEIVENELANSAVIAEYGDAYTKLAYADTLLDNNLVTVEFLKFNKEFQGTVINFVDEISTTKETPVAMRNVEKGKEIQLVEGLMRDKFASKAWTKMAIQPDGSQATALPAEQFKSFNEFLTFALLHEKAHEYILKDENETIGQYEDRINQEGIAKLADIVGPSNEDLGLDDDLTTEDFKC